MIRVGINGFGRIGRSVFRILSDRNDIEVVAINDLFDNEQLAYLLKYDTVMRVFDKEVTADADYMYVDGKKIAMTAERDPAKIPWGELGVDIVVESTGVCSRARRAREAPRRPARRRSILTVPPKDEIDAMIVDGRQRRHAQARAPASSRTPPARPTAWRRSPRSSTSGSASRKAS